jgi:hypothetical protein
MIKFVDEKGKTFFECHPAEARTAMEIIADIRARNPSLDPWIKKHLKLKTTFNSILHKHLSIKEDLPTLHVIIEGFKEIENNSKRVSAVLINSNDFAEIRKWNRNDFTSETKGSYITQGIMGYIFGAITICTNTVEKGTMIIVDEDHTESVHIPFKTQKYSSIREKLKTISKSIECLIESGI